MTVPLCAERQRLAEAEDREKHWRRWGPYLSDRAWGTVREDYSANGDAWNYLPHDHARSRAYRWTEDGLLGICDNHQYLCFALALWNGKDSILKERLFGLTGPQGNHGEDVKELYYYLDATPTASYLKALYKYPQTAFPYDRLVAESKRLTHADPELEIEDTGVFQESRYFDVFVEYAKRDVDDLLIRVSIVNQGPEVSALTVLPHLWFRNTWAWGTTEGPPEKPLLRLRSAGTIEATHHKLGTFLFSSGEISETLFTSNETNATRLFGNPNAYPYVKDAFHQYVVEGRKTGVNPAKRGTKACVLYNLKIEPNEKKVLLFRLHRDGSKAFPQDDWPELFDDRLREADEFYSRFSQDLESDAKDVQRQAAAGLFWSKQFYHFVVETWLNGDSATPKPPEERKAGRNAKWRHLFNEDVISMPDKWEYPWYAAWDLAFHAVALAPADPEFAKGQLSLFLREWYMHPNGQLPAYEWSLSDVNPPVHAWAVWRVFQIDKRFHDRSGPRLSGKCLSQAADEFHLVGEPERLSRQQYFRRWISGLDNIGIFNRSAPMPAGWMLKQADGSSWMAMYSLFMLKIAFQLADVNPAYEDIASKFFEHFLYIADAINHDSGSGLWSEEDGFYYDRLQHPDGHQELLKVRSLVGLVPIFATNTLDMELLEKQQGFMKRMQWFVDNRPDLTAGLAPVTECGMENRRLLSVVNRQRLERILACVFDEKEFLSLTGYAPSRYHENKPYTLNLDGAPFCVDYEPGESQTGMFGGNSNWRGPVWFPMNFLLIETLQRLHHFYGDSFQVEFPTGSGTRVSLGEAARLLSCRLISIFLRDKSGKRPFYGSNPLFQDDPNFKDYVLFYEYFHGNNGMGLGANHQTGWTGLVAKLLAQSGAPSRVTNCVR